MNSVYYVELGELPEGAIRIPEKFMEIAYNAGYPVTMAHWDDEEAFYDSLWPIISDIRNKFPEMTLYVAARKQMAYDGSELWALVLMLYDGYRFIDLNQAYHPTTHQKY